MKGLTVTCLLPLCLLVTLTGHCMIGAAATVSASQLPVRFAIIGDRTGGHEPGIHGQIVQEIERLKPDFVITVGDMIEGYDDDTARVHNEWDEYLEIIKPLSMPIYYVPGNHDIWSDLSYEIYRERVAEPNYSFDCGGIHITIMENGRWDKSAQYPEEYLAWIADDLAASQDAAYRLVFVHKPFWEETVSYGRPDTLHSILKAHHVDAVITGHYHEYFNGIFDGIMYTSIGSSGGGTSPNAAGMKYHYAWVTVDEGGIHIAPITMGSVQPWDIASVEKKLAFDQSKKFGLAVLNALPLADDGTTSGGTIAVQVNNVHESRPIADTLRWEIPEGWTITPQFAALDIPPRQSRTITFTAASEGYVQARPMVSIRFPDTKDGMFAIQRPLRLERAAQCVRASRAVVVDGNLAEDCWREPITRFTNSADSPETDPTRFYFAYDQENVYLAAYCEDGNMDSLVVQNMEHDGTVHADDCVGYFINPGGSDLRKCIAFAEDGSIEDVRPLENHVYQIYINPRGTVYDVDYHQGMDGYMTSDKRWNGEYDIKTARGKNYWIIEARIPLAQFGLTNPAGQEWRINFRRKQPRLQAVADWQQPISADPADAGVLVFEK